MAVFGRNITVDGVSFHIRGVGWNPVDKGKDQNNITDADILKLAQLDAPVMAAAHINMVRLFINDIAIADKPCHCFACCRRFMNTSFMDVFHAHNISIMLGIPKKISDADLRDLVQHFQKHPALLFWSVGNVWNHYNSSLYGTVTNSTTEAVNWINHACNIIKETDAVFGRPVASVYGDEGFVMSGHLDTMPCIDLWGAQAFRGLEKAASNEDSYYPDNLTFTTFFYDYYKWTEEHNVIKPLFMGEYGLDAYNERTRSFVLDEQAAAIRNMVADLDAHSIVHCAQGAHCPASGGFVFEWADEWWKDKNAHIQNVGSGDEGCGELPCLYNEEFFGMVDIHRNYTCLPSGMYKRGCSLRPAYFAYATHYQFVL
eukprot:gene26663-32748_t